MNPVSFLTLKRTNLKTLMLKAFSLESIKKPITDNMKDASNVGDLIILLSDGVTECRTEEGFIEREDLIGYIETIYSSAFSGYRQQCI